MNTNVIRVDLSELEKSENEIKNAAEAIKRGELVVFPTETVYGLGADGTNRDAVKNIYLAKGRPSDNPLIIHLSDPEDAEKYTYTDEVYYKLARAFMPGPLTVVLRSREVIPTETRGGLDTVAVRCPSHPVARRLIELSGVPVAAPSANLSGSPSPTSFDHVVNDMMGRVSYIIDGGMCEFGLESTIVKIEDNGSLTLLRPGRVTVEELSLIADVTVAHSVVDSLKDGEVALSPGMKYRHYAPKSPVVLLDGESEDCIGYIRSESYKSIGVICYSEEADKYKKMLPNAKIFEFGSREDKLSQAKLLFSILREADKYDFEMIYAPLPERDGVGLALYNRMIRAAAHRIIKVGN